MSASAPCLAPARTARARRAVERGACLTLAVLALGFGLGDARAQLRPEPAGTEAATLFQVPRLPAADTVVLRSGEVQHGTFRTARLRLQTAEGELDFPASAVAGLDLSDTRGGSVVLVTTNLDRLSGFVSGRTFSFQPDGSTNVSELRRDAVAKFVFRAPVGGGGVASGNALVRLRSGDFFRGKLVGQPFLIDGANGLQPVGADDVLAVAFSVSDAENVEVEMRNRQRMPARLAGGELEFNLAHGQRLAFPAGRIQDIRRAGGLPPELLARLGVKPTTSAGAVADAAADPAVKPGEDMVWIAPGEFTMGSPPEEKERDLDEGPLTRVIVPEGFWICRHEVTQAEYEALMGANPSRYAGDGQLPVEKVTWPEAQDYCRRLTARERAGGRLPAAYEYRLPTEAEWEFACRAGTSTRFSHGDDPASVMLPDYAWFGDNSDSSPHPVGTRKPNPWGLYDMHGNVLEWCLDAWRGQLPGGTLTNVVTLPAGTLRVARGGSWLYPARASRSANRDSYGVLNRCSDLGFRVVLARASAEVVKP